MFFPFKRDSDSEIFSVLSTNDAFVAATHDGEDSDDLEVQRRMRQPISQEVKT
jgi:hypothetical protein